MPPGRLLIGRSLQLSGVTRSSVAMLRTSLINFHVSETICDDVVKCPKSEVHKSLQYLLSMSIVPMQDDEMVGRVEALIASLTTTLR